MIAQTNKALQGALEAIDIAVAETRHENAGLIGAKCRGMLRGYDKLYRNAGYETLHVEKLVTADLVNPETQRTSRTFSIAGKIDIIAKHGNKKTIIDHKTTSLDISDPNAPYWRQLVIEGQVSHYALLSWLNGEKVDDLVWDVMRKPGISPKKLAKAEKAAVVSSRKYFNVEMSTETLEALQVDDRETLEMYEARLAHDCMTERPQWYFQRRPVPRMDNELLEYAGELWDHGQEILNTRNSGRNVRNSGACMLYGSACKFLGICSGYDTPDSDKWQKKQQVHTELPDLQGDGKDVLTNSRIRCFQTCKRKHYYQYELGIERQDEEEREALLFGSIWHLGLNQWWSYFTSQENENGNSSTETGSPANSVGKSIGAENVSI